MARVTIVEHDGTEHSVDIEEGSSLMQIAVNNAIPGIDADCGGECACGTCHVIVTEEWFAKTGDLSEEEVQMLALTPENADTSRLACQVQVTDAMDGMTVRLPEFQM